MVWIVPLIVLRIHMRSILVLLMALTGRHVLIHHAGGKGLESSFVLVLHGSEAFPGLLP